MDEKKEYSIIGKVEIGTDEYRDLIEDKLSAQKEASEYRSNYWREQNKTKELQEKVDELQAKYDKAAEFIKQDSERYQHYVAYIAKVNL